MFIYRMVYIGSAVKEVLRQTAEFETKAAEILNKELDQTDPASIRELEEVIKHFFGSPKLFLIIVVSGCVVFLICISRV